jgi:hypothetical protein
MNNMNIYVIIDAWTHVNRKHIVRLIHSYFTTFTQDGFGQSTTFDKKVLAVKLRIVTILHRNGYFHSLESERATNMLVIEPLIMHVWSDFTGLNEVRSAIRDEFEEGMMTEMFRMVGDSK